MVGVEAESSAPLQSEFEPLMCRPKPIETCLDLDPLWQGSVRCSASVEIGLWTCFRCTEGRTLSECGAPGVIVYTASGRAGLLTPLVLDSSCLLLRELERSRGGDGDFWAERMSYFF